MKSYRLGGLLHTINARKVQTLEWTTGLEYCYFLFLHMFWLVKLTMDHQRELIAHN